MARWLFSLSLFFFLSVAKGEGLTLEIFVSEPEEVNVTSALIMGDAELLVMSTQGTRSAAMRLADRIESTGLRLKYVFLSHPHMDHSQGASVLRRRFPSAEFIATPEVAKAQRENIPANDELAAFRYGANAAIPSIPFSDHQDSTLYVDGHKIEIWKDVIGDGGLDGPHSALYVPSLNALLPSDTIYFDAHVMLVGSTSKSRQLSIKQIDSWLSKAFTTVVPGHMPKGSALTARGALEHTRAYIESYETAVQKSSSSDEVISYMLDLYPKLPHSSALYLGTYVNFGEMDRALAYLATTWKEQNPQPEEPSSR